MPACVKQTEMLLQCLRDSISTFLRRSKCTSPLDRPASSCRRALRNRAGFGGEGGFCLRGGRLTLRKTPYRSLTAGAACRRALWSRASLAKSGS